MRDLVPTQVAASASLESAVLAINALGLDLHRQMPKEGNLCLSPYSIQSALAMTYMGASGVTQGEMARVLHYPADKQTLGESFAALEQALEVAQQASMEACQYVGQSEPIVLRVASQLFGHESYEFRHLFLTQLKNYFGAPLQLLNFSKDSTGTIHEINVWVTKRTQDRIRDLIPKDTLTAETRLVLVNAIYFKAAWTNHFKQWATSLRPFHVNGCCQAVQVPTMQKVDHMRYYNDQFFQAVTLSFLGGHLHFLLIVPNTVGDIACVEAKLTPELLLSCAQAEYREVMLDLPKFKTAPPTIELREMLENLGMTTAFDNPCGSADFDAMAPKLLDDGLYISKLFHKTTAIP